MADVHRVLIEGKIPYDIVGKLTEKDGLRFFAMFSSPTWGLRISYGKTSTKPVPETKGQYTYYEFRITGEEAIWESSIVQFCKNLIAAGTEITKAECMDMEVSYMPSGGSIMNMINK